MRSQYSPSAQTASSRWRRKVGDPVSTNARRVDQLVQLLQETNPARITGFGNSIAPPVPPAIPGFVLAAPRFLQALDHLTNDDKGWLADCPICTCEDMTIRPDQERQVWVFGCQDGCTHEEVAGWLEVDVRLYGQEEDENYTRIWMCMMLAPTAEIFDALLKREHVAGYAMDQTWLARFEKAGVLGKIA